MTNISESEITRDVSCVFFLHFRLFPNGTVELTDYETNLTMTIGPDLYCVYFNGVDDVQDSFVQETLNVCIVDNEVKKIVSIDSKFLF